MTLEELRKARSLSQRGSPQKHSRVNHPAVAKLEKRGDMHVSNLRRYIEALGGTLEINGALRQDQSDHQRHRGNTLVAVGVSVSKHNARRHREERQCAPRRAQ